MERKTKQKERQNRKKDKIERKTKQKERQNRKKDKIERKTKQKERRRKRQKERQKEGRKEGEKKICKKLKMSHLFATAVCSHICLDRKDDFFHLILFAAKRQK